MRLRQLGDESTLEVLALSYRMQRVLQNEHNLTPIKSAVLLLLGSFAIQSRSEEVTCLSVPEILALLSYSKSNKVKLYYAVQSLCAGERPYLKKEQKGRTYYYTLTAQGIQLIREAVKQAKVFRFEVTQIQAAA